MKEYRDEIRIADLKVFARHGVFPEETERGQNFYVNAVLYTDIRKAGREDDLTFSTNYGEAAHFIHDYLQAHTFQLIETAAERLAEQILLTFPLIYEIDLEIRKPEAPIGLSFASVSVKITRSWKQVYVAVGSNLGDKEAYIRQAVRQIKAQSRIRKVLVSDLLSTTPYGGVEQPDFLNGVLAFETLLTPEELLCLLQELERLAGREKKIRWGTRTLDLDILLYEDVMLNRAELTIPHPDMHNRDFVLLPLAQLNPSAKHPLLNKSVRQLCEELKEKEKHVIVG